MYMVFFNHLKKILDPKKECPPPPPQTKKKYY